MMKITNTAKANYEIQGFQVEQYTSAVLTVVEPKNNKSKIVKGRCYNMAEFTAVAVQTVAPNQNVLYTETPVCGTKCIVHRPGSGLVTVKGITKQCHARYKVTFGANIAIPTGGTVGAISLAIALDGEPLLATQMIETPAAVAQYFNVAGFAYIDVPCGCCNHLSVVNTSTQNVSVQNANLIVERVA